jgi:hypothetical protein
MDERIAQRNASISSVRARQGTLIQGPVLVSFVDVRAPYTFTSPTANIAFNRSLVYIRYHKPLIRRHYASEFPDPAASSLPAYLSSDHSDEWTSCGAWQLHERDHSRTARPIVALRS